MRHRSFRLLCAAAALTLASFALVAADTIRLKNGSVIRGQVVGFRDEQFTVLMEPTARGRRNRITVYMEEVESIEFDAEAAAASSDAGGGVSAQQPSSPSANESRASSQRPTAQPAEPRMQGGSSQTGGAPAGASPSTGPPRNTNTGASQPSSASSQFFPVRVRVRADNSANGWTDSGLMVRRGQRLRVSAEGRISLGQGRFSTPTGLPRVADTEKLMREEPTGALIAVIGDDNDEFILIGGRREFTASRDGRLFLGVNEGNLNDNTGTYDALIEAEPVTSGQARP